MSKEEIVAVFVTLCTYEGIDEQKKCLVGKTVEIKKFDGSFATIFVEGAFELWPMKAINWGDVK